MMPQWRREGHYDAIGERLFGELICDRPLPEYDRERAGSFALRTVARGSIALIQTAAEVGR